VSFEAVNAKPEQRAQALALLRESPWLSDREVARRAGLGNKTVSRLRAEHRIPRGVGVSDAGPRAEATPGLGERVSGDGDLASVVPAAEFAGGRGRVGAQAAPVAG